VHRTIFDLSQSNSSPFGRIWEDIEAAGAYLCAMNVHNAHSVCYFEHNVLVGAVAGEREQVYNCLNRTSTFASRLPVD
jgi:hypothetical protein